MTSRRLTTHLGTYVAKVNVSNNFFLDVISAKLLSLSFRVIHRKYFCHSISYL